MRHVFAKTPLCATGHRRAAPPPVGFFGTLCALRRYVREYPCPESEWQYGGV